MRVCVCVCVCVFSCVYERECSHNELANEELGKILTGIPAALNHLHGDLDYSGCIDLFLGRIHNRSESAIPN